MTRATTMGIGLSGLLILAVATAWAQPDAPPRLAITGATLIDPARGIREPGMTLLTEGERILAVFGDGQRALPADAAVHDLGGRYLIPGLIESHTHLTPLFMRSREAMYAELERMLHGGVVAAREMAGDARISAEAARAVLSRERIGPDIHYSVVMGGPGFAAADFRMTRAALGHRPGEAAWAQAVDSGTDLPLSVARAAGTHARALKLYLELDADLIGAITAEAHRQGLKVWAHATVYPARPVEVVRAGVNAISHACGLAWQDPRLDPAQFEGIHILNRPRFDPALVDPQGPAMGELFAEMVRRGTLLDATLSMFEERPQGNDHGCTRELAIALTRAAHEAGVRIAAGTDYFAPPDDPYPALHREIEYLVEHGVMTPAEALVAATYHGALALGMEDDYGTVEPGKLASFVILGQDPLDDIRALRSVDAVVTRGRIHTRGKRPTAAAPGMSAEQRAETEQGIREALLAEQETFRDKGCTAALAFFADWQPLFVLNGRTLPSRAALNAHCERMPAGPGPQPRRLEHHQVHVLAPVAGFSVSHYRLPSAGYEGRESRAQVVTKLWVKSDGGWRIVHLHESIEPPSPQVDAR